MEASMLSITLRMLRTWNLVQPAQKVLERRDLIFTLFWALAQSSIHLIIPDMESCEGAIFRFGKPFLWVSIQDQLWLFSRIIF